MTSRSTVELSAILTISVAGKPAFTTTSTSHHASASGGTAVEDLAPNFRSGRVWLGHHAHVHQMPMCLPRKRERLLHDADG